MPSEKKRALLIVESPSKAKKIATYVPNHIKVMASVGHIRDLPSFRMGVNISNHFAPTYLVPKDKQKIVNDLRKAAEKASTVYLASDPDREGESIAWHLYEVLKDVPGERDYFRIRYNEVTKGAVLDALAHPTAIDQHLVDAQQARRIEDRLSGFKISKLVASEVEGAKSAGRVQSVALRLIVDREKAIGDFRPTPYWLVGACLEKGAIAFEARLASVDGVAPKFSAFGKEIQGIESESVAQGYLDDLSGRDVRVCSVERKTVGKRPQPPFITSTLQQAAATHLGFSPDQTMRLAQSLYEDGHITYMRTDGYTVSASIRGAVEAEIEHLFGRDCVPASPNVYGNKVKNAQEAHEPIRPTDVSRPAIPGLEPQQAKLYDLIWRRFIASQMASARFERTTLTFEPVTPPEIRHDYRFTASAQRVVFKGFLNVWAFGKTDEETDVKELPVLDKGDTVFCREWICEGKETQPPARYNEASLVKALEENGIGRPSTYASTVRTLRDRNYVASGRNHVLTPTATGIAATEYLYREMPDFINVEFTAQMEDALDRIADGSLTWESEVADFYGKLTHWLAADPAEAAKLLETMRAITQWRDPVRNKSGKVAWDDRVFFEDMVALQAEGTPISKTQLDLLVRMANAYRDQIPRLDSLVPAESQTAEQEEVERLFTAAKDYQGTPWENKFLASVKTQYERKGSLSEKQISMIRRLLDKPEGEEASSPNAQLVRPLLKAFENISQWKEPVKRGRRVYDDKAFVESLGEQFREREELSDRQLDALRRLAYVYRAQIPDFPALAEKCAIKIPAPRAPRGAKKATPET